MVTLKQLRRSLSQVGGYINIIAISHAFHKSGLYGKEVTRKPEGFMFATSHIDDTQSMWMNKTKIVTFSITYKM